MREPAPLLALLALVTPLVGNAADSAPDAGFTVENLAPGVHALVRTKPAGFFLDSNVLVVESDEDVVVVDANLTPSSAERSIAAIRGLTKKPVRLLVNTHRHHDHVGGNEVYRREFPGVEIVASAAMAADFAALGQKTMEGWTGWAAEMVKEFPKNLESGKNLAGQPLSDEERASYKADLAAAQELVADTPRMHVVAPTRTIEEPLVLRRTFDGRPRTIEIRWLGKGHTRGDLVVWLPEEKVVATGDLLVAPVPLVGADQSFVEEWIETFGRLQALGAKTYLPGHGAVQRDDAQLVLYRGFLSSVRDQTRAAMAKGLSSDDAVAAVDVTVFRDKMAGSSPVLRFLFANWGRGPTVAALYRVREEASAPKP